MARIQVYFFVEDDFGTRCTWKQANIWHILRKEDSPVKPCFIQEKSTSEILRWYVYVEIGPRITIRSFWCKQPTFPSQDTREVSKARFIYLPQYDTWMNSRARYSAFFSKQPPKASSIRYRVFPQQSL